ncbi:MAG: DNA-protecting protein DprA [Muribaculaceae bacterium]|nr:DNA-protecting protein DprA [Muribaculaceae bacterium]
MDSDLMKYRIAFASIRGIGIELAQKILEVIPSEKDYFDMPEKELRKLLGVRTKIADTAYRKSLLEMAAAEVRVLETSSIKATYFSDNGYPERLLNVCDAPLMLYSVGDCNWNCAHTIAVVGTRHATYYGQEFCENLISDLSQKLGDFVIVSGLAYGIDIAAHRACLKHNVPTIAVVAHGLNTIYPPMHRPDAQKIVKNGCILSDYTTQEKMHKGNFVARNRIVAGMCDCTIVVESAIKGGALITASLANSYNRDVFALPGKASDEFSKGCNKLIRNNEAALITCADDLIAAMQWTPRVQPAATQLELFPDLTAEEQAVYDVMKKLSEAHVNTIAQAANMPIYRLLACLVSLEFKGLVRSIPGSRYVPAK